METLEGKVVIVTGASEGIGAQLATALRLRKAKLVLTARMRRGCASRPMKRIWWCGRCHTRHDANGSCGESYGAVGRIDVLINNAGRGSYYSVSESTLDDARALFELNFFAPLHLSQLVTPFIKRGRGTIVNISSIAGQITLPWLPLYSASKFALTSLTSSQRMELERSGVNVMAVFPGYVNTGFQAHAAGSWPPDRIIKGKRFAVSVQECAAAILRELRCGNALL